MLPKGIKQSIIDNTWKVKMGVGGGNGCERRLDKDGIKKENPRGGRQGTHFVFKQM